MEQRQFLSEANLLAKRNQDQEALWLLRDALRRNQLDAEGVNKAGRLIARIRARNDASNCERVLLLGQCTTSWLGTALVASAWRANMMVDVVEGQYDNVMQELMSYPATNDLSTVVLLPWAGQQFLEYVESTTSQQAHYEEVIDFWKQAHDFATRKLNARVLQVGFDWMTPGPLGYHIAGQEGGSLQAIRQLNVLLRNVLPAGSYFVDLEQVSGTLGREAFYDYRRYYWTKQPFSEAGTCLLANHIAAGIRALVTGPKKVLVVDLDNTLWGGVVGEAGPLGISLGETPDGEAFRAFQKHLKALSRRGVTLAVSSKNNMSDAVAPFETNSEMVLKLEDFAHIEANWDPKMAGLRRISETLNLGLDSMVFFDDNPAEREHIRQALPEVEVVEVPEDPANFVTALQSGLWFESVAISQADTERATQYQHENQRRKARDVFGSMDAYLESLEMRARVTSIDDATLQRVVQLIGKTNQFNLTTHRHSLEAVRQIIETPRSVCLCMSLADRFGDHGLIAVLLAMPEPQAGRNSLRIDTWLMSCRVIGRTAEQFLFNTLVRQARQLGYTEIVGEYLPTAKNVLVAELYGQLGFVRIEEDHAEVVRHHLPISTEVQAKSFVLDDFVQLGQ